MAPQLASALASVSPLVQAGALPPQRAACPFTPQQLDVVRGVMQKVALQPDLLALPELTFVNEFLTCVGGRGYTSTLETMLKGLQNPQAPMQPPPAAVAPAPAAPVAFPPAPSAVPPAAPATVNEMESMASVLSVLDEISSQSSTPRSTASTAPAAAPSFASAQPPPPLCLQMLSQGEGQSPATTPTTTSPSPTLSFPMVGQPGQLTLPQPTTPTQASVNLQNILAPQLTAAGAGASPATTPSSSASSAPAPPAPGPAQPQSTSPSNPILLGLLQPVANPGEKFPSNQPATDGSKDDEKANIDPRKYKTRMCRNWVKEGRCTYEHTCCFAHGEAELRNSAANICVLSSLAYFKSKQDGEAVEE